MPQSTGAKDDQRLLGLIKHSWLESGGVYGYRKIHDDLREVGEDCGRYRVARLMRLEGLRSQTPESFKLVDLAPLELLINNEPIKFQHILDELIKSNRKDCQLMQVLLQNGEIDDHVELAHRIKGAAQVVKGEQLVECCRKLEAACQDSKVSSEQLQQLVGQVETAIVAPEHALLSLRQL